MEHNGHLAEILRDEVTRHPRSEPGDLWKLIVQAVEGGDHLRGDPDRFAAGLAAEWAVLPTGDADEPPLQRIDPDGRTARLHLRPCKARAIDPRTLTDLLLAQPGKRATPGRLEALWADVIVLAERGEIPFDPAAIAAAAVAGVPRHSARYGFAAYRIVNDVHDPGTRAALRQLGLER